MMLSKTIILLSIFFFTIYIEGSSARNYQERPKYPGYRYLPQIQGWLKLHYIPADWYTARVICHDEEAVLAAPLNKAFESVIWGIQASPELYNMETSLRKPSSSMYIGMHTTYPEGIYGYNKKGKSVLSLDSMAIENVNCASVNQSFITWVDCSLQLPYLCYAPAASACGDQLSNYSPDSHYEVDERTGQCYKFHYQSEAWNDAHRICQQEGSHLAIVNSDIEAEVLVDLFKKYSDEKLNNTNSAWSVMALGFYYWRQADKYVTIYGQTLEQAGYAKWSEGNPSGRGKNKELGGGMFRTGLLDDVDKSFKIPFICEKTPIKIESGF